MSSLLVENDEQPDHGENMKEHKDVANTVDAYDIDGLVVPAVAAKEFPNSDGPQHTE